HVDPRVAAEPDAVRRSGQDDVAGPQRDMARGEGDERWNAEHHVRGGAGLHDLPIHDGFELEVRNGNGVRRLYEGADGTALVHVLAERPLTRAQRNGLKLRCAAADVVRDGVSEYTCGSRSLVGVDNGGAHDSGQLDFPVEPVRFGSRHRNVCTIDDKLGWPSREQV